MDSHRLRSRNWQQNMNGAPPQQPGTNSVTQPRRALAINDMLNHPPSPGYTASSSRGFPSTQFLLSQPPRQSNFDFRSPFPPAPGQTSVPQDGLRPEAPPFYPPPPGISYPQYPVPQPPRYPPNPAYQEVPRDLPLPPQPTMNPYQHGHYMTHPPVWQSSTVPEAIPAQPYPTIRGARFGHRLPTIHDLQNPIQQPVRHMMANSNTALRKCMICLDEFFGEDIKLNFLHSCGKCSAADYCTKCIKEWFIDACKNESKMPPKCCSVIPLSTIAIHLETAQIELYKAKYEEWNTPERVYCPVPSCSAFIPPRLYIEPSRTSQTPSPECHGVPTQSFGASVERALGMKPLPTKRSVPCPTCSTSVCTQCRSFTHAGECPKSDLDPLLEEQLKKWKVKRCPKCRGGVRKMFGCSHIECRCGAHFCYECLLPINQCDGQCEDESDAEPNDEALAEDDLDGRERFYDGDGHDLGQEPYGTMIDTWGCDHVFTPTRPPNSPLSALPNNPLRGFGGMECRRCFRPVEIPGAKDETQPSKDGEGDIEMADLSQTKPEWPPNHFFGKPIWQCSCGHARCNRCPKDMPDQRFHADSWAWMCEHGKSCVMCEKNQAAEKKEKEDKAAWQCRCGMTICGACKQISPP